VVCDFKFCMQWNASREHKWQMVPHHQKSRSGTEEMTASWTCFSIDLNQDHQQLGGGGQILSETLSNDCSMA
jgi:hypothetical protein